VQNLIRHGLIAEKKIPHPEPSPRRLLTLTKQGHLFLTVTKSIPKNQAIHYGFTKPREAHHDAACIGCITWQPIRSSARAGGISA
jgi:hypothetical protein